MNNDIGDKTEYLQQRENFSPVCARGIAGLAQTSLSRIKSADQPHALQALCTALNITTIKTFNCFNGISHTRLFRKTAGQQLLYSIRAATWLTQRPACRPCNLSM